jgi:hypothetical protein
MMALHQFCRQKERSGRFLKKAAQKLLLCWAWGGDDAPDPN